ncbi:response regulator transcription factor [Xylophilus sp. GOD-11R]|uniref:response regulator transcription factor n=1 Tax=Xylophilus sp. GOD-11R TaxID=3089814 RepID=UPI00298D0ED0|nr:response regulator transcription factor [Xylophilus sp. GOD-11R]WPB57925.1 response regulator transcription factor [Xylophilus sp. GOD-11R]
MVHPARAGYRGCEGRQCVVREKIRLSIMTVGTTALEAPSAGAGVSKAIHVAVLDDHAVVRYGIELLTKNGIGFAWTGAAATAAELLGLLASRPCHVLVLDYQLSSREIDGWSLVRRIRSYFPHVRILVYTSHESKQVADVVRKAGAHGFLAKSAGLEPLLHAIRALAMGETLFAKPSHSADKWAGLGGAAAALSPRENEVLRCFLQGMSVTSIALKFQRSVKTVSSQKRAGFRKLGVHTDHEFLRQYGNERIAVHEGQR